MNKNIVRLIVGLLVVIFALGAVGPALAMESPCPYSAKSTLRGTVPLTITVEAPKSPNVSSRAWSWGDLTPSNYEANVSHTYNSVGEFTFTYVEFYTYGHYCAGQGKVVVEAGNPDNDNDDKDDSDSKDNDDDSRQNSGPKTNQEGLGLTAGDNSPVVNGNGNVVLVVPQKEEDPAVQQPLNIAVNIQPVPVTTQKTNIITAFIHATFKATETFFRILDESWFVPVLVK